MVTIVHRGESELRRGGGSSPPLVTTPSIDESELELVSVICDYACGLQPSIEESELGDGATLILGAGRYNRP